MSQIGTVVPGVLHVIKQDQPLKKSTEENRLTKIMKERVLQSGDAAPPVLIGCLEENKMQLSESDQPQTRISSTDSTKRKELLTKEGFPFSKVSKKLGLEALEIPIEGDYITASDVLNEMLRVRVDNKQLTADSPAWKEMETVVEHLYPPVLSAALRDNYSKCLREKDSQNPSKSLSGGYCVHVLLKMALKKDHPLPNISEWSPKNLKQEIKDVLGKIDFSTFPDPRRIIDLILYRPSGWDDSFLLDYVDASTFFPFVFERLNFNFFAKWPNKGEIIIYLFEILSEEYRLKLIKKLYPHSCDHATQKIGEFFQGAFSAKSSKEFYSYLYRLSELIPSMNEGQVERIFGCAFPPFEQNNCFNPPKTRHLSFNCTREVLIDDNLIIGSYRSPQNQKVTLLAFDETTGRPVWGLPINGRVIHCNLSPLGLSLVYAGVPEIQLFDPKEGTKKGTIGLPATPKRGWEKVYITPSGFCYFMVNEGNDRLLFGGKITDGKWTDSFKCEVPIGFFHPLGEFLCFKNPNNTQFIIAQGGYLQEISNCTDLLFKNGRLFTTEVDVQNPGFCLVTEQLVEERRDMFQLKKDSRKKYRIKDPDLRLADICKDNTVICCHNGRVTPCCFIDIGKQEMVDIEHVMSLDRIVAPLTFIDTKKTEIWSWDREEVLCKHTEKSSEKIGAFQGSQQTCFVHVDSQNRLCFLSVS